MTEDTEIVEQDDGSAIVTLPEAPEKEESSHFENLAEKLKPYDLNSLATDLLDLIEKDQEARKKRDEQQEEGIKRTGLGGEAPGGATFDGATRAVHPALAEGCVDFSARAIKELFPPKAQSRQKSTEKLTTDAFWTRPRGSGITSTGSSPRRSRNIATRRKFSSRSFPWAEVSTKSSGMTPPSSVFGWNLYQSTRCSFRTPHKASTLLHV